MWFRPARRSKQRNANRQFQPCRCLLAPAWGIGLISDAARRVVASLVDDDPSSGRNPVGLSQSELTNCQQVGLDDLLMLSPTDWPTHRLEHRLEKRRECNSSSDSFGLLLATTISRIVSSDIVGHGNATTDNIQTGVQTSQDYQWCSNSICANHSVTTSDDNNISEQPQQRTIPTVTLIVVIVELENKSFNLIVAVATLYKQLAFIHYYHSLLLMLTV